MYKYAAKHIADPHLPSPVILSQRAFLYIPHPLPFFCNNLKESQQLCTAMAAITMFRPT